MRPRLKDPDDYGLYCFRLRHDEREQLTKLLEKAKARLNKSRKKNEHVITKNKILFEAIKLGLPLIKKEN